MVRVVNDLKDFKGILKEAGNRLVVVDFFADWCGPCQQIAPKFIELSNNPEYKNVIFLKVNVDEANEIASSCGVKGMPTFQFYKNGKMVDEFTGANPEKLIQKLTALKT